MEKLHHNHIDFTQFEVDASGRTTIDHAIGIPYDTGAHLWQQRNKELRNWGANYQVVTIGSEEENSPASKLVDLKTSPFSVKYPVAYTRIQNFPDGEDLVFVQNEAPLAEHIIIFASPTTYKDLAHIQQVAGHYKNELNARYITLLTTYLIGTRQDKNCDSKGGYQPTPINIDAIIRGLFYVDSFMVVEPHSFGTQTAAAEVGKPLFPATPWKYLMDMVLHKEINIDGEDIFLTRENTIIARPDKGRNIAASRISNYYELEHVSFDKKRLSPTETKLSLPPKDRKKVKGKICVLYDDEFNTCQTIGQIATKLREYGALGLIVVGVHGKFTGDWKKYIENPMIKKIYVTDSRRPIGDITPSIDSGKIEVISLQGLICQILEADARRVNFWADPKLSHMVLQPNGLEKD
jgi:phosphoribosylpyrophosphate synthetase